MVSRLRRRGARRPFLIPARGRAVLTGRRHGGAGLHLVTLVPPAPLARAYGAPGQYVEVSRSDPGFFVLAGDIGAPAWELLVRDVGGVSDELARAPEGTTFEVSAPLGAGFPLDCARQRPLVVAVAGTALAAARPVVRRRIAEGHATSTYLYLGVRTSRELPLPVEVAEWANAGPNVVVCCSQPEPSDPEVSGTPRPPRWSAGRVQRVLAEDLAAGTVASDAIVFAAGPQAMLDELRMLARPADKAATDVGEAATTPSRLELEVVTNV